MMEWYMQVLRKFADFNGRARRKEYWMFTLFNTIIYSILVMSAALLGKAGMLVWAVVGIYALAIIVPCLAVSVRRLHDTGKSGWFLLLAFVPLANFVLIVFMFFDSQPGANLYGPNPKGVTQAVVAS